MDRTTEEAEESCTSAEDDVFLFFSTSYFTLPTDWAHKFYVDDTLLYDQCSLEGLFWSVQKNCRGYCCFQTKSFFVYRYLRYFHSRLKQMWWGFERLGKNGIFQALWQKQKGSAQPFRWAYIMNNFFRRHTEGPVLMKEVLLTFILVILALEFPIF